METVFKDWSASISVSSNSEIVRVIFYISIFFYFKLQPFASVPHLFFTCQGGFPVAYASLGALKCHRIKDGSMR